MADAAEPRSLLKDTIAERDRVYAKMRELIPELGAGPVDRSMLTDRQRAVLTDYQRLDALVRRLRQQTRRHDHP